MHILIDNLPLMIARDSFDEKTFERWTDLYNGRLVIQLRNLVWATSKHDIYFLSRFSVIHWSTLSCMKTEVLNVSGHVAPCEVSVNEYVMDCSYLFLTAQCCSLS